MVTDESDQVGEQQQMNPDGKVDAYFAIIPERLLYEAKPRAIQVYGILRRHANEKRGGKAWPKRRTLARLARCSVDTIDNALTQLADAGWLQILPQFDDGRQIENAYYLYSVPRGSRENAAPPGREDTAPGAASMPREVTKAVEPKQVETERGASLRPAVEVLPFGIVINDQGRRRDLLWEQAVGIWGEPVGDTERGRTNKAVALFREGQCDPEEMRMLCAAYQHKFSDAAMTAIAVANRIGELRAYRPSPEIQEAVASEERKRRWRHARDNS